MKARYKYLVPLFLTSTVFFLLTVCSSSDVETKQDNPEDDVLIDNSEVGVIRDITSMQLVEEMKAGWSLGNALDTEHVDETFWGNPLTTRSMIDAIKQRGFGTLRIPVTWRFHMGPAPDYTIESSWLDRVEQIVKYGLENDMYVIINIHHDDPWIIPTYAQADAVKDRLTKVWTQIANRFRNYSDYLIFETINEPRHEGSREEWTGGTAEGRDVVNQYHKACLDAIRATGGNNELRHVMISSYAASQLTIRDLVIPNNDPRTIVSLHYYFPFQFTLEGSVRTWGSAQDKSSLDWVLDEVYRTFIVNDIPVIMGEWGAINQNNTNFNYRLQYAEYYANACVERKILPIVWDNGDGNSFGLFNRRGLSWNFPQIADAIIDATKD